MKYTVTKDQQQSAPLSIEEIVEKVKSGTFALSDLVWTQGWNDWKPLSSIIRPDYTPISGAPPPLFPPFPKEQNRDLPHTAAKKYTLFQCLFPSEEMRLEILNRIEWSDDYNRNCKIYLDNCGFFFTKNRTLSRAERFIAGFNFWAFLFGPFYYLYKGKYSKGALYFIASIISVLFLGFITIPIHVYIGMFANLDFYLPASRNTFDKLGLQPMRQKDLKRSELINIPLNQGIAPILFFAVPILALLYFLSPPLKGVSLIALALCLFTTIFVGMRIAPGSTYLHLGDEFLVICSWYKKTSLRWADISEVKIISGALYHQQDTTTFGSILNSIVQGNRDSIIALTLVPEAVTKELHPLKAYSDYSQKKDPASLHDFVLPENYGLDPKELAEKLQKWKSSYTINT